MIFIQHVFYLSFKSWKLNILIKDDRNNVKTELYVAVEHLFKGTYQEFKKLSKSSIEYNLKRKGH